MAQTHRHRDNPLTTYCMPIHQLNTTLAHRSHTLQSWPHSLHVLQRIYSPVPDGNVRVVVVQELHGLLRRKGLPFLQQAVHLSTSGKQLCSYMYNMHLPHLHTHTHQPTNSSSLDTLYLTVEHMNTSCLIVQRTSATSQWLDQLKD